MCVGARAELTMSSLSLSRARFFLLAKLISTLLSLTHTPPPQREMHADLSNSDLLLTPFSANSLENLKKKNTKPRFIIRLQSRGGSFDVLFLARPVSP
jgi:hypothetical protein